MTPLSILIRSLGLMSRAEKRKKRSEVINAAFVLERSDVRDLSFRNCKTVHQTTRGNNDVPRETEKFASFSRSHIFSRSSFLRCTQPEILNIKKGVRWKTMKQLAAAANDQETRSLIESGKSSRALITVVSNWPRFSLGPKLRTNYWLRNLIFN